MLRHIICILLLAVAGACPAASNAAPIKITVEQQIIELERQLTDALLREDSVVLERLWSDSLVFTFPNGKIFSKTQRLAAQKPQKPSPQLAKGDFSMTNHNDEVKVYLYGDTAVVTVLSTWKGKAGAQEYSDQYQATHVWVRQRGRWQLVAAQVGQVKKG